MAKKTTTTQTETAPIAHTTTTKTAVVVDVVDTSGYVLRTYEDKESAEMFMSKPNNKEKYSLRERTAE